MRRREIRLPPDIQPKAAAFRFGRCAKPIKTRRELLRAGPQPPVAVVAEAALQWPRRRGEIMNTITLVAAIGSAYLRLRGGVFRLQEPYRRTWRKWKTHLDTLGNVSGPPPIDDKQRAHIDVTLDHT